MRLLLITGAAGLLALLGLLYYFGASDIALAVREIGWGVGLIILLRLLQMAGAGAGWRLLSPQSAGPGYQTFFRLRMVREGLNTLLPTAQVGGEFVAARLLAHSGFTPGQAAASVIVDLFLQAATQALFTVLGLGVLAWTGQAPALVREVAIGLLAFLPSLGGFFLVQRFGGFGWIERQINRLAQSQQWLRLGQLTDLNASIQLIYRNGRTFAWSILVHFTVWLAGAGEIWIALAFMGQPVTPGEALIIESLAQALRSAAFVMPGALGVQEGGIIALCAVFGLPATVALAVSMAKRVADLVVGGAGLILWQRAESRLAARQG